MVIVWVEVLVQCWSAIVNVTVLTPALVYITPVGFSAAETGGFAPTPRFHEYDQLLPVLPVLVKLIPTVEHCGALLVNVAVGVWWIRMVFVAVTEQPEVSSVTVNVTVLLPAVE